MTELQNDPTPARQPLAAGSAVLADDLARVVLYDEVVELSGDELDRLLEALAGLDLREAEAVGEQIAALRLIDGRIDLMPTGPEIAALRLALDVLAEDAEAFGPELLRLAAVAAGDDATAGVPAG